MARPIFFSMASEEESPATVADIQPNDIPVEEDNIDPEEVNVVDDKDIEDGEDSGDVITDHGANESLPIFFSMGGDVQEGSKEQEDVQPNDIPVDEDKIEPEEVTEIDSPQEINDDKAGDILTEPKAQGKLPIFFSMEG